MSDLQPLTSSGRFEPVASGVMRGTDGRLRSIWRFLLSVVVVIAANTAAAAFASFAGRGRLFDLIYRSLAAVFVVVGFVVLLKTADGLERNQLRAMGLAFRKPWIRDAVRGLLFGALLIFVAFAVIELTCELTVHINLNARSAKLLVVELVVLAAGAMLEEAMFRGYPFQRLVESCEGSARWLGNKASLRLDGERATTVGALAAAVLWSAAFGALHLANPGATVWSTLNTALVGVLFCIVYLRTRSLWMPWGMHFAWNTTLGVVLGLPVSGLTDFGVVVRSAANGPLWVTGGKYGIEGSALGTSVILLGIVIAAVFVKPRPAEQEAQPEASQDTPVRYDGAADGIQP